MPFRKLIYFPPNIDVLKKTNPQNERAKSISTFPSPIQRRYTLLEKISIRQPIKTSAIFKRLYFFIPFFIHWISLIWYASVDADQKGIRKILKTIFKTPKYLKTIL